MNQPQDSDRNRFKFEIQFQVQNLKRKIEQQNHLKEQKNYDAKKAALAQIFKNRNTVEDTLREANEVRHNLSMNNYEPIQDPIVNNKASHQSHEFSNKIKDTPGFHSPVAASMQNAIPDSSIKDNEFDLDFQKSQKFDQHIIRTLNPNQNYQRIAKGELGYHASDDEIDEEVDDEVYEDDFENDESPYRQNDNDDKDKALADSLDKNMEIPIAVNPNNRYNDTFGMSQDSLVEVSNMNPLEESDYNNVAKRMNFYDSLNVGPKNEDIKVEHHQDTGHFSEQKQYPSDFRDQDKVFNYDEPDAESHIDQTNTPQKEVQMSFKFENKVRKHFSEFYY